MVEIKNRGGGDLTASAVQCLVHCAAILALLFHPFNHTLIIDVIEFVKIIMMFQ
jgi:hypothetical protein